MLTPEGETLFRHVEPAVNLLVQGERQLIGTNTLEAPLRIGASDTICRYFLVPYLQRFHKEFPQVTIKVTNATSIGCAELLEHHQIDFAFCNYPNSSYSFTQITKPFLPFRMCLLPTKNTLILPNRNSPCLTCTNTRF